MARVTEVEYERVEQACLELFRAGESISFAKVYQLIGSRGGQQVVTDMIRRWRQDIAQRVLTEREHPELPPLLIKASDDLIAGLWKLAQSQSQLSYRQQVESLEQREAVWQARLESAQAYADQVERENLGIQGELARAQGELQAREAAYQDLSERHQTLQALQAQTERARCQAREQISQLEATLQAESLRHEDARAAIKEQHASELRQVRLQADADRKHFMLQTDELRQSHRSQADSLRVQFDGARTEADTYRKQLNAARDEASRWQGRAEVTQQELLEIKGQATRMRDEAARWQGRAEVIQEELVRVRRQLAERGERTEPKKEANQPAPGEEGP